LSFYYESNSFQELLFSAYGNKKGNNPNDNYLVNEDLGKKVTAWKRLERGKKKWAGADLNRRGTDFQSDEEFCKYL
jgi:hypothetical protein